jgi:uncharacterized membrane protein YfcA
MNPGMPPPQAMLVETPDMSEALWIIAGAIAGGFVSGLTGFGTGLTALPVWLQVLPPPVAAPLVVVCSVSAQLQTMPAIWREIDFRLLAPFLAGGLIGVPLGVALLPIIPVHVFKGAVGLLLVCYCSLLLLDRHRKPILWGGRWADAVVGVGGGIGGGLAGLSGPLPTLWASVRGWEKAKRRGVFQSFNLCVLGSALAAQAMAGLLTSSLGSAVLVALPGTLVGAWAGRRAYDRLDTRRFDRLVLLLLLAAGLAMLGSVAATGI